uniref:Uncharacterized protein n=1 Tax=Anguilla anguilla TaxID=7936 RepID=A0A0E9X9K5_ANGAN
MQFFKIPNKIITKSKILIHFSNISTQIFPPVSCLTLKNVMKTLLQKIKQKCPSKWYCALTIAESAKIYSVFKGETNAFKSSLKQLTFLHHHGLQ